MAKYKVSDLVQALERIAPRELSEAWDNTGLLLGDAACTVDRLMTCLTLTDESVTEAIDGRAELVVAHHPLPFKPLSRITTESISGKLLWKLATAGISVYSPHTAWDGAELGINWQLANHLNLESIEPLVPLPGSATLDCPPRKKLGAGRHGWLQQATEFIEVARRLNRAIPNCRLRGVDGGRAISHVGLACGSGGSLLTPAISHGCDLLITGEATFHTCLEAKASNISLLLIGHFASEKFALAILAQLLARDFPGLEVWSSRRETDPVQSFA